MSLAIATQLELSLDRKSLPELEQEIRGYLDQSVQCWWEVGRRLLAAKAKVQHGGWGKWLEENFDLSQDTAENLMTLGRLPNSESIRNLPWSKAYAIVRALPDPADREEFLAAEFDTTSGCKTAKELTQRETKRALAEWKEAPVPNEPEEEEEPVVVTIQPPSIAKEQPHVAHNSGQNEWYTPSQYIEAARDVMESIDLDPASSPKANETVGAKQFYTAEDDGLSKPWHGSIWLNPPYAQPLVAQFCEAVAGKFEAGEIKQACVLVNNATETGWFQRLLDVATAVCFPTGRIKFLDQTGQPGNTPLQGQAILYLGTRVIYFADAFKAFGRVLFVR